MKTIYPTFLILTCLLIVSLSAIPLLQRFTAQNKSTTFKTDMIMVNHVGFLPGSPKYFVIPKKTETEFNIFKLQHTVWTKVFSGTLIKGGPELYHGWIGRFTELNEEGVYQIRCGKLRSRCFVVHNKAYDVPMRVLFNYFPWQRCGDSKTGWAASCHLDDGIIAETGEKIDLSGGYHQSCDLRKWAEIQPLGLMGLIAFGKMQTPRWGEECVEEEIKWGCDYFHKLVREDGGIPHSVFIPIGWGPREYYLTDAPVAAHWMIIRYQAMAAGYFKTREPAFSDTCLHVAKKIWQYMNSEKRPKGKFKATKLPPLGHDGLNSWWSGFYEGSAIDHAHRLCAAIELYRFTGDSTFLQAAAKSASALTALQVADTIVNKEQSAACFREGPDSEILTESYSYCWHSVGPLGLCEILKVSPEHPNASKWRRAVERIAEQNMKTAQRNPWGLIATHWYTHLVELPIEGAFTIEGSKSLFEGGNLGVMKSGEINRSADYEYNASGYNFDIMAEGLFMRKAAEITGNDQYIDVAQRQLDWIMGCNPFDASTIEGVGYNQPHRGIFGEFFPPTPQIPGAVSIGINEGSFSQESYGFANEYDMPPTGFALWLMSEIASENLKSKE